MRKKYLAIVLSFLTPLLAFAQEAGTKTIDERINDVFAPITTAIESVVFFTVTIGGFTIPFVLIWLIFGAIFFTVYMNFINITAF